MGWSSDKAGLSDPQPWLEGYWWSKREGKFGHLTALEAMEALGYDRSMREGRQFQKGAEQGLKEVAGRGGRT